VKLLILADFPPDGAGGGATIIRQMLHLFPGRIDWWSTWPSRLSNFVNAHNSILGRLQCDHLFNASPGFLFPNIRFVRIKVLIMEFLWANYALSSLFFALAISRPDQIWIIPHEWSILPFKKFLSLISALGFRIPVHVSIHDFPNTSDRLERLGFRVVNKMALYQRFLYRTANSRDAISLPMSRALGIQTRSSESLILHAGLEKSDISYLKRHANVRPANAPVIIAYAGTIIVEPEFEAFVSAIEKIRFSFRCGLELRIWSSHSYESRPWFSSSWMTQFTNLPEKKLQQKLRLCDWGFVPMSFSDQNKAYNRYSFPTKFVTYMSAGLPVISLGHPKSALMKMTQRFDVGIRICSLKEVPFFLKPSLLESRGTRKLYRNEILRCAEACFDADKMRISLWNNLLKKR
jgi:hypothetical protein